MEHLMENKVLDSTTLNCRGTKTFPYLQMFNPTDEVTVLISNLKEGNLPLVIKYNGKSIKVKSIDCNLLSIKWILQTGRTLELHISESVSYPINTIEDMLNVKELSWMD